MSQKTRPPGVAQKQLVDIAQRRKIDLPHPRFRVNLRQLGIYAEVRERFSEKEPSSQSHVRQWMKGELDKTGKPSGAEFANNLAALIGYESGSAMLDAVHIDHFFPQSGLPPKWAGHIANMVIIESGFNQSAEFKERGMAKQAFFGNKTYRCNRAWLKWQIQNPYEKSLDFFTSSANRNGDWVFPIRASDGVTRSSIPSVVKAEPCLDKTTTPPPTEAPTEAPPTEAPPTASPPCKTPPAKPRRTPRSSAKKAHRQEETQVAALAPEMPLSP